jgi:hypothetical protein
LKTLTFITLFYFTTTSFASLYIAKIPNNYYTVTTQGGLHIYAGSTVNRDSCTGLACDSCASLKADFTAQGSSAYGGPTAGQSTTCSLKEVHPDDNLTLMLASTTPSGVPSNASMYYKTLNDDSLVPVPMASPFTGSAMPVSIAWSRLCESAASSSDCTEGFSPTNFILGWSTDGTNFSESVTFNIAYRYVSASPNWATWCGAGFSGNFQSLMEGFCSVNVTAGDRTAMASIDANTKDSYLVPSLENSYSQQTRDASGMNYSGVAVFYTTDQNKFTTATPMQVLSWDVKAGQLQQNTIYGLKNGITYYFAVASIDQAGVLSFFTNPADENFTVDTHGASTQAVSPHP